VDGARRERAQRDERRPDVRRLGVVDVEDAVALPHLLEAVGDAREGPQRRHDRGRVDAARQGHRRGRRRVGVVVGAAQADLVRAHERQAGPPQRAVTDLRGREATGGPGHGDVLGRHRDVLRALAREDAQLGRRVGLERPVTVEVVLRDVQQHRRLWGELERVLQLE